MASVYRIHPAIGIGRVGPSLETFLQGEALDAPPFTLDAQGQDAPFQGYKDADYRIRRQAVRFRVLEYDRAEDGTERFMREITAQEARIDWRVSLAASKAAGPRMGEAAGEGLGGDSVVRPFPGFRNAPPAGHGRDELAARVDFAVSGANADPTPAAPMGAVLGRPLFIGTGLTDAAGRLVVLPGFGEAASWANPIPEIDDYLNNATWYDDVADGPVDARVFLLDAAGQVPAGDSGVAAEGAWFTAAPPDFAPDVRGIVTLLDIIDDAWRRKTNLALGPVTYVDDMLPLLERAAGLQAVNDGGAWQSAADWLAAGGLDSPAGAAADRQDAAGVVASGIEGLNGALTPHQSAVLAAYVAGDFTTGPRPPQAADPGRTRDEAVLGRTVGAGFFPGIEIGFITTLPTLWAARGRLTRGDFTDHDGGQRRLEPGALSQRMACPWQADFLACRGVWWPAQRPDLARFDKDGNLVDPPLEWDRGVADAPGGYQAMVDHFAKLGVVQVHDFGAGPVQAEIGRDPQL